MIIENKVMPTFHNKADKKTEVNYQKWLDNGFFSVQKNREKIPNNITWLPTDSLTPLDTQRDTKSSWIPERLSDREGFDWTCFAPLSVAKSKDDPNYYVFDGCGRWLMAQFQGVAEVPCYVMDITKKEAAFLFAYTQDRGRRNLSKEIIFANLVEAEEEEALEHKAWLEKFNLYVEAANDVKIGDINGELVKYRFVKLASQYPDQYVHQVLSWIRAAWPGYHMVQQDMAMGMLHFIDKIPEAMKNGLNQAITDYFANVVSIAYSEPKHCKWKRDGGNEHNQEKESVALGFFKDFSKSKYWKTNFRQVVCRWKFEPKTK